MSVCVCGCGAPGGGSSVGRGQSSEVACNFCLEPSPSPRCCWLVRAPCGDAQIGDLLATACLSVALTYFTNILLHVPTNSACLDQTYSLSNENKKSSSIGNNRPLRLGLPTQGWVGCTAMEHVTLKAKLTFIHCLWLQDRRWQAINCTKKFQ